jgi:protein HOOK3
MLIACPRPEVAIALRQRLNETVEELDVLKKAHTELEVKFDTMNRELTIAKSDRALRSASHLAVFTNIAYPVTLVNKDQLDILSSLRESLNDEKADLESENEKQKKAIKDLQEKNHMQLEQINGLLLDKMSLQSEGIGQRERLLQRDFGFVPELAIAWSISHPVLGTKAPGCRPSQSPKIFQRASDNAGWLFTRTVWP